MNSKTNVKRLTVTALLTAITIVIPIVMPIRVVLGPMSFTLASHVPIFIAMFFSPMIAVLVSLASGVGFLISGTPIVIVIRAFSHVIFALLGAMYLKNKERQENLLENPVKSQVYSFVVGAIHAGAEMIVVSLFFFGLFPGAEYEQGFYYLIFFLVGLGTLVHSMIDFIVAQFIWRALGKQMKQLVIDVNKN